MHFSAVYRLHGKAIHDSWTNLPAIELDGFSIARNKYSFTIVLLRSREYIQFSAITVSMQMKLTYIVNGWYS